tara:strand:+ start:10548 stop:10952 length:405 start_codon:yes stop_codon:yes gene_type:complete
MRSVHLRLHKKNAETQSLCVKITLADRGETKHKLEARNLAFELIETLPKKTFDALRQDIGSEVARELVGSLREEIAVRDRTIEMLEAQLEKETMNSVKLLAEVEMLQGQLELAREGIKQLSSEENALRMRDSGI